MDITNTATAAERMTATVNTDRVCEMCGTDWRGTKDCPVCGYDEADDDTPALVERIACLGCGNQTHALIKQRDPAGWMCVPCLVKRDGPEPDAQGVT